MHRHNPCLVKIHRSYTVEEIASLYGVHKNTVRHWIKQGLTVLDKKRPVLVRGAELSEFIRQRRKKNKKPCKPGEIYCVRCREPRLPANLEVDYQSINETLGNLIGICPCCEILIYRRVSLPKLESVRGDLSITMPVESEHLIER